MQARGGIHGVADDRGVVTGQHHLAGRDPDAGGETDRQGLVERLQTLVHLDRGPHGAQAIVLVGQRHAEDGDHRVADEFLHPAPVALGGRAHLGEVALQDRAQQFGVVALSRLVDPTRSQNSAVTVLRVSDGATEASAPAHSSQNFAPSRFS